jgi:hypothetical protein
MVFASPLWLVWVLPWAVLVGFLLPGRGTLAVVPFVALWKTTVIRSQRRARRWPGLPILLMLFALLTTVLAAANPRVKFHLHDSRILQPPPKPPPVDAVAITWFAVRAAPHPQAMVRLENQSDWKSIHLTITSGANSVERDVALPSRGKSVESFVDLGSLGPTVTATVTPHSSADPQATAYLSRNPSGVQLVVDPALDDAVKRMAAVYIRDRINGPQPQKAIVSNRELPADQPGVWIASASSAIGPAGTAVVIPNALTRNVVSWPAIGEAAAVPDGFVPVVSTQQGTIMAMRESPSRQVWINAGLSDWEKTVDFVIFFGNVFDWISGGDEQYQPIAPVESIDRWKSTDATTPSKPQEIESSGAGNLGLQTPAIFLAMTSLLAGLLCWRESVSSVQQS